MMNGKIRSANFSSKEVDILCELVSKYKDVIENKKSDSTTWKDKEETWRMVEDEFNARAIGVWRSGKTLKLKYETIKKVTRKKSAQLRADLFRTGGGPNTAPPLNTVEEKVKSMILLSVEGMKSKFDSDAEPNADMEIADLSEIHVPDKMAVEILEEVPGQNLGDGPHEPDNLSLPTQATNLNATPSPSKVWNSQSRNKLKKPKHPLLQGLLRGSKIEEIENEKLSVIALQKEIAQQELRMKQEEEKQARLRYEYEGRQRDREEEIKEIELKIKQHQLKKIENEQ